MREAGCMAYEMARHDGQPLTEIRRAQADLLEHCPALKVHAPQRGRAVQAWAARSSMRGTLDVCVTWNVHVPVDSYSVPSELKARPCVKAAGSCGYARSNAHWSVGAESSAGANAASSSRRIQIEAPTSRVGHVL